MTGYDIKQYLDSLGWLIGKTSFGSIYPNLHALLEGGLVTVDVVSHADKPPRKIYSTTEVGCRALQEWTEEETASDTSLKAFIMRLILADSLSRESLIAHLQQRQAQVAEYHAVLVQMNEDVSRESSLGRRLAREYALAIASAELDWLEDVLGQLSTASPSEEVTEGNLVANTV
jgi:DNA-binding PadR family transcriptional regulator